MTAVLTNDGLLRFRVQDGMLNIEFAVVFPLNTLLQDTLVRRKAKSGLSLSTDNILSPVLIKTSSSNRRLGTAK